MVKVKMKKSEHDEKKAQRESAYKAHFDAAKLSMTNMKRVYLAHHALGKYHGISGCGLICVHSKKVFVNDIDEKIGMCKIASKYKPSFGEWVPIEMIYETDRISVKYEF